jgi:hypothetical protein
MTESRSKILDTEPHGQWFPVRGCSSYFVSPCGAVLSLRFRRPRLLTPGRRGKYQGVTLVNDRGAHQSLYVHRLILTTIVGEAPEAHEGAHLDGNPLNNRITNLAWTTRAINHSHKRLHGTSHQGARHPGAKLSDAAVLVMRQIRALGAPYREIAEAAGVTVMTAHRAINGKNWSHM